MYCQVDRTTRRTLAEVDLTELCRELADVISEAVSGRLWEDARFSQTPAALRRVNDIAFSGDGEPTLYAAFDQAVQCAADVRHASGLEDLKLVVITNASLIHQPQFQRALPILKANNGEIWAKLDAGTEGYFQQVDRPAGGVTLERILRNITTLAKEQAVVIQTLWLAIDGLGPPPDEIAAYIANVRSILNSGGEIKLIQLHTIARPPACSNASPLSNAQIDELTQVIGSALSDVQIKTYYGASK